MSKQPSTRASPASRRRDGHTSRCQSVRGAARDATPLGPLRRPAPLRAGTGPLVPLDRFGQPVAEAGGGAEAELPGRPAGVQAAARLAIRPRAVPADLAPEAAQLADEFDQ